MVKFRSGLFDIAYEDGGHGRPVVLLHGFGLNSRACWLDNGWQKSLADSGFRMIAMDSRGHGESTKSTVPADYSADEMTGDVLSLMDHLNIRKASIIGHSMGGRILLNLLVKSPDRVKAAIGVSIGSNVFAPVNAAAFIKALNSKDSAEVPAGIRKDVELIRSLGNDMSALVACLSSPRPVPTKQGLNGIRVPFLLVNGAEDHIVGDAKGLVDEIFQAQCIAVAQCGHADVLGSTPLRDAAIDFLRRVG